MNPNALRRFGMWLICAAASSHVIAQSPIGTIQECVLNTTVLQRFIPVELLTGLPLPDNPTLVFAPVERVYSFVNASPDAKGETGEVSLAGPVQWTGEGGIVYEVYERKVPLAHERFALTADKTAIGRVYDQRFGNAKNEGKFPVGLWKQGQKRSYDTVYYTSGGPRNLKTMVEIEKLSCIYDGVAGAIQYRWTTTNNRDYGYIYAPGRGVVQVAAFKR